MDWIAAIAFLRKNWAEILTVAIVIALAVMGLRIYAAGGRNAVKDSTITNLTDAVHVKEKQDEIRNHRPDTDALVKRLRSHSF